MEEWARLRPTAVMWAWGPCKKSSKSSRSQDLVYGQHNNLGKPMVKAVKAVMVWVDVPLKQLH